MDPEFDVQIIEGPSSEKVSKEEAEISLKRHRLFPKNASVTLSELDGKWIAAIATPKVAGPPFGGGDVPTDEAAPAGPPEPSPESEGPPKAEGEESEEGEKKPPHEKGEKGKEKGGVDQAILALTDLVTQIAAALGIGPSGPDASMVPGAEVAPPPGAGAPGPGGEDLGSDGKHHTVHERALKPGEAQPGSTPIGAPAFASVREDHPWKEHIGKVASFKVSSEVDENTTVADIQPELLELAHEGGYNLAQVRIISNGDGKRQAEALISRYGPEASVN